MDLDTNYTFVPLTTRNYVGLNNKSAMDFLLKWGLKGNLIIQNFSFNEPFQPYHKYQLADAFFKNDVVARELLTKRCGAWVKQGIKATFVEAVHIPCSVTNMSFFDRLTDPKNNILRKDGNICKRYDIDINGFLVSDNLRGMLLDEECPEYSVYTEEEKEEFIFCILKMLALGGILCQYEDSITSYLDITRCIYKDLIRVQKQKHSDDLCVSTLVLKVVAKDSKNEAYFPSDISNIQNVGFLLIDGPQREVTTVLHQYGVYNE